MKYETSVIDKLFLELSQITKAKTASQLNLEKQIKELAGASTWEEHHAISEIVVSSIENRKPKQFAINWFEENR